MKALIGASIQPARPLCASPGVRVVPSPEMPSPRSSCGIPRFIFSLMAHSSSERSTSKARVWWNPVNEAEAERVGRRKEPGRAAKRNFDRGAAAGSGAGRRRGAGLGRIRPERRQELALVPLDNPAGRNNRGKARWLAATHRARRSFTRTSAVRVCRCAAASTTIEAMDVLRALYGQFDPARPLEVEETDLYVNWQEEKALAPDDTRSCWRAVSLVRRYPFAECLQAIAALGKRPS